MTLDAAADKARRASLDRPPKIDVGPHFQRANAEAGGIGWLGKLLACLRGPGSLTIDEFFYYQLYRPEYDREACLRFIGKKAQARMHHTCNDWTWYAPCHDKVLFYTVLEGADLPVPETPAIFSPRPRPHRATALTSDEELGEFLAAEERYSLFLKPIDGMFSIGTMALNAGGRGEVEVAGHGAIPLGELGAYMREISDVGYLIQRCLRPDPEVPGGSGSALPTVRLLLFLGDEGPPEIVSAVIKLPGREATADNFWREGNALGAIDLDTGTIRRIVMSVPEGHRVVAEGEAPLGDALGVRVPRWAEVCALATRAALAFPGVRTQSWDIGLAAEGPMAIEFNFGGDLNLHQLAHGHGLLTPHYVEHLKRCGYRGKLP